MISEFYKRRSDQLHFVLCSAHSNLVILLVTDHELNLLFPTPNHLTKQYKHNMFGDHDDTNERDALNKVENNDGDISEPIVMS